MLYNFSPPLRCHRRMLQLLRASLLQTQANRCNNTAEKLSAHAARGEWAEMPVLITDEMLNEFCLITGESSLGDELKKRYGGISDRLALYAPFVPEEKVRCERLIQHFKTS